MRTRFAVTLATVCTALFACAGYSQRATAEPVARFSSAIKIPRDAPWVGGLSGLVLSENGLEFHMISDRGTLASGKIVRNNGALERLEIAEAQPIVNRFGVPLPTAFADAEGLAVHPDGRIFISFETEDRVSVYAGFDGQERLTAFTREWRVFPKNKGLEALALAPDGALWAIPEHVWKSGTEGRIYRLTPGGRWQLHAIIPTDNGLRPVGADFGPDGYLYLLERGFFALGFYNRVRRLKLEGEKISWIETVLQTISGRHGNLEGISVWQNEMGDIVITMVSDDNFQSVQRNQMVEYVLDTGVAPISD